LVSLFLFYSAHMKKHPFDFDTETVNSITHALGILFGIIFIPMLINRATYHNTTSQIAGIIIYGCCFMLTFVLSTLFHFFREPKLRVKLRLLDHISIYFLIAATYTPLVLLYMYNTTGIVLLSLVWCFALTGIYFKLNYFRRFAMVSVISYVVMGLLFLWVRKSFFANMPADVIRFIYFGVAFYLLGIIFFLWQKWKHHHAIWHLFVLAGGICHFRAIWLSVV
jgi:hemolysin III